MLKLDQIKKILSKAEINRSAIARNAGLPVHAVRGVLEGENPRYKYVEALSDYLENNDIFKSEVNK